MTRSTVIGLFGLFALISYAGVAAGCGDRADDEPTTAAEPLEWGERYVRSAAVGRLALEDSLVEPDNGYARLRLANYGPGRSWNDFAVADPDVRPVTTADLGTIEQPWAPTDGEFEPLGELVDWSHESVLAYGKRAFERYPLATDSTYQHAIDSTDDAARFGAWTSADGRVGGLVRVRLSSSSEGFAPTCSTCHASVEGGLLVAGRPNADFDYDAMALHGLSGAETYPTSRWGAGAVDVTPDQTMNPVAMADLRAVRHQTNLHWAGTIHNSLSALTVRIETLIITSLRDKRPPREVAFAIAYYLWNLGLDGEPGDDRLPGAALFETNCASCHGADGATAPALSAEVIGTQALVAESTMRGLSEPVYRVPSLWKAGSRGQFLHHGQVGSLEELFDPTRLEGVPGHAFGTDLSEADRAELIDFVRSIGGGRR